MSGKGKGRRAHAFKVTVDFPDPLPVTPEEVSIVETYMRDIVQKIMEMENADAPPEV